MNGLFVKQFNTVIMDASDEDVVRNITEPIDIITKERYGRSIIRPFNSEYPIMKVIVTTTTKKKYRTIRGMIERAYPTKCIFNVK